MIIRQFLEWFMVSDVNERIEAAATFCDAYIQRLPELYNHPDVETALTLILDDKAPAVRRVLAEALAGFEYAPRHIIVGLAQEYSDISIPVLARSMMLSDADLIDCLAIGDDAVQSAIAVRNSISAPLAAAIAEIGGLNALALLLKNPGAAISPRILIKIAERFGKDADTRQLLLQREDLPVSARYALVINVSSDLMILANSCGISDNGRSKRLETEANEQIAVYLASSIDETQILELVEELRLKAELKPSLILRALICGNLNLFEAALSILSNIPFERVKNLCRQKTGASFLAVYKRAGMPAALELAFKTAYIGALEYNEQHRYNKDAQLSRPIIRRILLSLAQNKSSENTKLLGLLHRLDAEAAREEARSLSIQIINEPVSIEIESEKTTYLVDFNALENEVIEFAQHVRMEEVDLENKIFTDSTLQLNQEQNYQIIDLPNCRQAA